MWKCAEWGQHALCFMRDVNNANSSAWKQSGGPTWQLCGKEKNRRMLGTLRIPTVRPNWLRCCPGLRLMGPKSWPREPRVSNPCSLIRVGVAPSCVLWRETKERQGNKRKTHSKTPGSIPAQSFGVSGSSEGVEVERVTPMNRCASPPRAPSMVRGEKGTEFSWAVCRSLDHSPHRLQTTGNLKRIASEALGL